MDIILTIIICLLLFVVLYLTLNHKITHLINQVFRAQYQNQLKSDIQEFYREMENYAVLFENRIQRFKGLVDRHERSLKEWKRVLSDIKTTKKAKEILHSVHEVIEKNTIEEPKPKEIPRETKPLVKDEKIENKESSEKSREAEDMTRPETLAEEVVANMMPQTEDQVSLSSEKPSSQEAERPHARKSERMERPAYEKIQPPQPPQPSQKLRINEEEIMHLIQDLNDHQKKPMALQVLMKSGFTIPDISEMSEIPQSELEAARNIYRVA